MTQPQTELFSEVSKEQASQVNGGFGSSPVMPTMDFLMQNIGSNLRSGMVGYPRYGGNPWAQFNSFDNSMRGILAPLQNAGIPVFYPY